MGICDLIPGISGGTIAFITGIYTKLINSVKAFSPKLLYDAFMYLTEKGNKKKIRLRSVRQGFKKLDLGFLIILLLGIGTAFLIGSRIIKILLENYFAYTMSFFIGLILASSKIILDNIDDHKAKNVLFGVIGLSIGIMLSILIPASVSPSVSYVFLGGFVAISAMFLPGISGAFILLIMGLYEFMINVLHDISRNIGWFLIFAGGALLGAFSISRIISFVFRKYKSKVLYLLLGLVIGALSIPVKRILEKGSLEIANIFIMIFFLLLGVFLVVFVNAKSKKKN